MSSDEQDEGIPVGSVDQGESGAPDSLIRRGVLMSSNEDEGIALGNV